MRGVVSGAMAGGRETQPSSTPSGSAAAAAGVPVKADSWIPHPISVQIEQPLKSRMPEWNTRDLGGRLAADFTAAACAGVLVAPVITMIDRYVSTEKGPFLKARSD